MKRSCLILFLLALIFFVRVADGLDSSIRIPFEHGSEVPPVIAVYVSGGYPNSVNDELIACIWPDGHAVWSGNRFQYGPPYFAGEVDPKAVKRFIAVLHNKRLFERHDWGIIFMHVPMTTTVVTDGTQHLVAESIGYSAAARKLPAQLKTSDDATAFLHQQIHALLPPQGKRRWWYWYQLRWVK